MEGCEKKCPETAEIEGSYVLNTVFNTREKFFENMYGKLVDIRERPHLDFEILDVAVLFSLSNNYHIRDKNTLINLHLFWLQ